MGNKTWEWEKSLYTVTGKLLQNALVDLNSFRMLKLYRNVIWLSFLQVGI